MVFIANVITFAHYKGGTGKTTSCINIAGFLQKSGYKVLLIDLDPQANLTSGMGIDKSSIKYNMHHVMKNNLDIRYAILKTQTKGIHIAPANLDLIKATIRKYKSQKEINILSNALEPIRKFYDFILIDTPPSNGHLIINGAVASDFIILVLDPGIFSLEGVESFKRIFTDYSKRGININIGMALINKSRSPFLSFLRKDLDISTEVKEILGKKVFTLPFSYTVLESQIKGMPISHLKPYSLIGRSYNNITQQIIGLFQEVKND